MWDRLLIHAFAPGLVPAGGSVAGAAVSLAHAERATWIVPLVVALIGLVGWSYHRSPGRRVWVLASLRAALLGMIGLAVLDPVVRLTVRTPNRERVLVLLDDSASLSLRDGGDTSRVDQIKRAFADPKLDLLRRLGRAGDVRLFAFGRTSGLAEVAAATDLTATGPTTPLGDAVADALARGRGQPTAAIVLVTDGQSNAGASPLAVPTGGVPLLVWGVGPSAARDVVVSDLYAPAVAFVDDAVPVTVHVRGAGLAGRVGHVVLKLGDRTVDERDVTFDGADQTVTMRAVPTAAGTFELTASVAPRPDEATAANNVATTRLRVVDGKLKVLLVDGSPRWEFKFLQAALLRDRRVSLRCLLQSADAGVAAGPASPYVAAFPDTREALFDNYDLVILGDVDPATVPTPLLAEFVDRFGGGLLVVPGKRHGLGGYAATPLAAVLPVDVTTAAATDGVRPVELRRTAAGRRSPTLRLAGDDAASDAAWAGLPPVYWAVSAVAKRGAETLLATADGRAVVAAQPYGRGQAMVVGTDNTWRWRRAVGEAGYAALWGQIVQRLALPHLSGESRRATVTTDRPAYDVGDRVTITARVYGGGFAPLSDPAVPGTLTVAGRPSPLVLSAVADEPGVYRGETVATVAGEATFALDRDAKAAVTYAVTSASRELSAAGMDEPLLRQMAAASGGAFFTAADVGRLPDAVHPRAADEAVSAVDVPLWSTPAYLAIMVAVAAVEWVLRKAVQLR